LLPCFDASVLDLAAGTGTGIDVCLGGKGVLSPNIASSGLLRAAVFTLASGLIPASPVLVAVGSGKSELVEEASNMAPGGDADKTPAGAPNE